MRLLKKADYFRKYTNDDLIQTCGGACVSCLALLLIGLFSFSELTTYMTPTLNREVTVMSSESQVSAGSHNSNDVVLNIDLTLYNTPCESIEFIKQM